MSKRITIYLPGELKAELEAHAKQVDRSVSYLLVKAWEEYKRNNPCPCPLCEYYRKTAVSEDELRRLNGK